MNPDLKKTQPYPFERLATLKATVSPPTHLPHIALSIGEPKHAPPPFVTWTNHLQLESSPKKERMLTAALAGDPPTRRLDAEWRQRCEDLIWTLVNAPEMLYRP